MFHTLRSRRTSTSATSSTLKEKLIENEASKPGVSSKRVPYVVFFIALCTVLFCIGFLFGSHKIKFKSDSQNKEASAVTEQATWSSTVWEEESQLEEQLPTKTSARTKDNWKNSLLFDSSPVYQGRPWDDIAHEVAIAVKTGKAVSKERIPKHNETWWKRIPNLLLISDVKEDEMNSVGLKEMYELLPRNFSKLLGLEQLETAEKEVEKQPAFFGEMTEGFVLDSKKNLPGFLALYKHFPNKKWYIMLDDDTFVFLDNLALTLQMDHFRLLAEEQPFYLGNPFTVSDCDKYGEFFDEEGKPNPSFAHGGSGIVLSKAAMEKIIPHIPWCIERWDVCKEGDARVGLCLLSFQVLLTELQPFFYHETPSKYFEEYASLTGNRQGRPEALPVTFHHIKGSLVDEMLQLEKEAITRQWLVTYADLAKAFAPGDFEFA
ncbi:hypothetical protein Gasu2_66700 [Galdieria sulphuraria]|uniref:N-acetylgalactosaminide beta-1,3-galactosyltransferase n=1 Tax=Galdieria sulphuraria TaxID=130081 RepID=M2XAG2_GALSU|nr:uncharacterized protein Gasu_55340 [Galdieria sulphuraria]EME26847.1 hypothetical protein Gasu_55340 [Galdieria sulphuraria]GJD12595.1 hypothetical protein Gasu2_66700 [Galdieria sulphuraria]|eukprot:XP_005703367.1 hypothetical protein Gasu_55340 [Galdieria sulphuraria]